MRPRRFALALLPLVLACGELAPSGPVDEPVDEPVEAPVEAPVEEPVEEPLEADPPGSRCARDGESLVCEYETLRIDGRDVHFQLPTTPAPSAGYPVVLLFQGSFFTAELAFDAGGEEAFGSEHQTELVRRLLDGGYAVLAPEAHLDGGTFWDTNIPPFSLAWETSGDHRLMLAIFDAIEAGDFGPLDDEALFATGISSGGFMTSRMAVSYPGRFRALAIHSGSYAICGAVCLVPALPEDHPPTLFITGEDDLVVPLGTVVDYHEALTGLTETALTVVEGAGHAWLAPAPDEIPAWFDARRPLSRDPR